MPSVYQSVNVVSTPALTIQEYIGNVASKHADISACLVTVTAPCEEPYQIAEFDEYLLVTAGLLVVTRAEGTTVVKAGHGLFLQKGMRLKISWPGPCQYIPICLPAFSPGNCHREEENGLMKDKEALEKLEALHTKKAGYVSDCKGQTPTAQSDACPVVHKSVHVVDTSALTITEYFGNVASSDSSISACLATVAESCEEAYQTPEFDEYVLVIAGSVEIRHGKGETTVVKQGEGLLLKAGERVKWVWSGPCQYVPICLPAFTPANCGRELEDTAVETPDVKKRLKDLHEAAKSECKPCLPNHFMRSRVKQRDLQCLPKANLHIHLEGAMRPDTLTALCKKHAIDRPEDTRWRRFANFDHFAKVYIAACQCLQDESDIFRLVREVAEDAKADGATWVEAALSQSFYQERFGGLEGVLEVLLRAASAAEDETGVALGYIVAAERFLPVEDAVKMAQTLRSFSDRGAAQIKGRSGIVGFGLHANEEGFPPEPFLEAVRIACGGAEGAIVPIPHAGEIPPAPGTGPASVRCCVDVFGAPRIGHGVLAAEDDELVAHLAKKGICLDVCPTSNYLLRVVGDLVEHPLPRLLAAGVPCSIGSDDPLLFGCSLLEEFTACRRDIGLSDAELAACARFSFIHSRAPEELKKRGVEGVDKWLADRK